MLVRPVVEGLYQTVYSQCKLDYPTVIWAVHKLGAIVTFVVDLSLFQRVVP
jgi:hypothetical protein